MYLMLYQTTWSDRLCEFTDVSCLHAVPQFQDTHCPGCPTANRDLAPPAYPAEDDGLTSHPLKTYPVHFKNKNLKQEWLQAYSNKIQTHTKGSKERYLLGQNTTCKFVG